jgi:hypothetical protein
VRNAQLDCVGSAWVKAVMPLVALSHCFFAATSTRPERAIFDQPTRGPRSA